MRAVIVYRFIYLRIYFSFRANQGNDINSLFLVKYLIRHRLNKLILSELQEPIKQSKSTLKAIGEVSGVLQSGQRCFCVTVACITTSGQSGFAELQMWRRLGLRLHATSHWHCSRAAMTLARAWLRGGLGEGRWKMHVKIMCLQDALYKAIKLSVSKTVHRGCNLCLWQTKIHFSCLFHCELYQRVVSFVGVHWKKKKKKSPDPLLLTKATERETRGILRVFSLWKEMKLQMYSTY